MTSVRCPHEYDTLCPKCQEQGAEYGVMNPAVKPSREEKFIEKFVAYQDMGAFLCDDSYIVKGWEISAVIAEIKRLREESAELREENGELKRRNKVHEARGKYRDAPPRKRRKTPLEKQVDKYLGIDE